MNTQRAFIVGCPRSGTTLLQSMIASHPKVVSFPETHFFSGTLPINSFLRPFKVFGAGSRDFVKQYLTQNGYSSITPFEDLSPYKFFSHPQWCQLLIDIIDKMTVREAAKKDIGDFVLGLEKTPRHLHYISSIEHSKGKNKFLHILRNGPDVVASLHMATNKYPNQWGGARSVKKCISWWNNSTKASMKYRNSSNHCFVSYEQLISDPEKVVKSICRFLDVTYDPSMIQSFHQTAGALMQKNEKWKSKNTQQDLSKSNKLNKQFDDATIAYINNKVKDVDLKQFHHQNSA